MCIPRCQQLGSNMHTRRRHRLRLQQFLASQPLRRGVLLKLGSNTHTLRRHRLIAQPFLAVQQFIRMRAAGPAHECTDARTRVRTHARTQARTLDCAYTRTHARLREVRTNALHMHARIAPF